MNEVAAPIASAPPAPRRSPWRQGWDRFRSQRAAQAGAWFLILFVAVACLLPWMQQSRWAERWPRGASYSPEQISDAQFASPNRAHWFGTDVHGRDLFARALFGARISLLVGVVGAGVSLVIGVAWGLTAGYVGGRVDSVLMRVVDVLYSLPSIIFVIVLMTALEGLLAGRLQSRFGSESQNVARFLFLFAGLGAVSWLTMARIVRGQTLSLRKRAFVEASRALGAGAGRILFRHILPNVFGVVIVYATLTVPSVVLYESFLSYLGLGIQPPQASLGSLIAEGAAQINPIRIYWWLILFPAGTLMALLLALTLLGDGLREAFDPRSKVG